jgi:hypothetical protein
MWRILVSKQRLEKQGTVAGALAEGMDGRATVHVGTLPNDYDPFIAIGQLWEVEQYVPDAVARKRPFWMIDNGYYLQSGSRGIGREGYYEFTYRGLTPVLMKEPDFTRFPAADVLAPWNYNPDGYVLLAYPGQGFGKTLGLDIPKWSREIKDRVRRFTRKPIRERDKYCTRPLRKDLQGASVVVTHSSHVAIDAIMMGIPAIVASTSPAAPVCSTNLMDIDNPYMPDRTHWWASLMCQQYNLVEMANGYAWKMMQRIMKQVDG